MELAPGAFNDLFGAMGQRVLWRRGNACPCRNPMSGQALQGCPICSGLGTFWGDPTAGHVGLTSMRRAKEWAAFGQWVSGDVAVSLPSDSPVYDAGEGDRFLFTDSSAPFSAVVPPTKNDRLNFVPDQVDRVFWIANGAVVYGDAPQVAPDGTVYWLTDQARPPAGVQYTVSGRRQPEYFMYQQMPQDRAHFDGSDLPRRVQLRLFDLYGSIGKPGNL
jgi:hypothetical protein